MDNFTIDIKIIERLKKGDTEAFDHIYEKYAGKLFAFGFKYLGSTEDSEELVQNVFIKVWENRQNIDAKLSFKSYLFTIAYHEICKFFRNRKYMQAFLNEMLVMNSTFSSEMEESIDYRSLLYKVQKIVDMLPEKQKIIFEKSKQEGKTAKEIAKEMRLSPGTVDNYISTIIKVIRERLKKEGLSLLTFLSPLCFKVIGPFLIF